MAMFCNRPLYHVERPQFRRSVLGRSLQTIGERRYRTGDNSLTIYSFEQKICPEDDPHEEEEEELAIQSNEVEAVPQAQDRVQGQDQAQGNVPAQAHAEADSVIVTADSSEGQEAPVEMVPPLAYWASRSAGTVHPHAVRVGADLDGGGLYVGRACLMGELLAGKVAQRHRVCYVASEGREIAFERYEVLVLERGRAEWVRCAHGAFPSDAFIAGLTLQGRRVYSARAIVNDVLTPGMLVVGESECRISFDMKEFTFPEYEVLAVRAIDPSKYGGALRHVSVENIAAPTREGTDPAACRLYVRGAPYEHFESGDFTDDDGDIDSYEDDDDDDVGDEPEGMLID